MLNKINVNGKMTSFLSLKLSTTSLQMIFIVLLCSQIPKVSTTQFLDSNNIIIPSGTGNLEAKIQEVKNKMPNPENPGNVKMQLEKGSHIILNGLEISNTDILNGLEILGSDQAALTRSTVGLGDTQYQGVDPEEVTLIFRSEAFIKIYANKVKLKGLTLTSDKNPNQKAERVINVQVANQQPRVEVTIQQCIIRHIIVADFFKAIYVGFQNITDVYQSLKKAKIKIENNVIRDIGGITSEITIIYCVMINEDSTIKNNIITNIDSKKVINIQVDTIEADATIERNKINCIQMHESIGIQIGENLWVTGTNKVLYNKIFNCFRGISVNKIKVKINLNFFQYNRDAIHFTKSMDTALTYVQYNIFRKSRENDILNDGQNKVNLEFNDRGGAKNQESNVEYQTNSTYLSTDGITSETCPEGLFPGDFDNAIDKFNQGWVTTQCQTKQ